jgi:hypothetical protein
MRLLPFLVLAPVVFVASLHAARNTEVTVVVDQTDAGRKVKPPTKESPAYYFAISAGFHERGAVVAGEKSPPTDDVEVLLRRALANQGYLPATNEGPAPTLLLVYGWGTMNPEIIETGTLEDEDGNSMALESVANKREMISLVGGYKVDTFFSMDRDRVEEAIREDRYFMIVSAYDFAAAVKREKKLLWRAKISAPSQGTDLAETLPTLARVGSRYFGRDTNRPAYEYVRRTAEVKLGEATVMPDDSPPPPPATSEAKP